MRRTSMKVALAVLAAGMAVTACGSTTMGAAAITGNQRISTATLTDQVANLSAAYQADRRRGVKPQRPISQQPQQVLTWLILFNVYDKVAAQHGISVSPAQVQTQLTGIAAQARQSGLTSAEYVSAAGALPPDLLPEVGRYFAILGELQQRLDGGKAPTTSSAQQSLQAMIIQEQCLAAKNIGIDVNPQFGEFDYSTYSVVPAPSSLAAAPTPAASSSPARLTPPC